MQADIEEGQNTKRAPKTQQGHFGQVAQRRDCQNDYKQLKPDLAQFVFQLFNWLRPQRPIQR